MSGLEKRKASSRNGDLAMQAKDGHELDSDDMFRLRRRQSNGGEVSESSITSNTGGVLSGNNSTPLQSPSSAHPLGRGTRRVSRGIAITSPKSRATILNCSSFYTSDLISQTPVSFH